MPSTNSTVGNFYHSLWKDALSKHMKLNPRFGWLLWATTSSCRNNFQAKSLNAKPNASNLKEFQTSIGAAALMAAISMAIPTVSCNLGNHESSSKSCDSLNNDKNETLPLPVGLLNLRNTCYMNSILQGLYTTQAFSEAITMGAYNFVKNSVGEEVQSLFSQLKNSTFRSPFGGLAANPLKLSRALKIDVNYQEDAEELMLKIINGMDESVVNYKSQKILPSSSIQLEILQTINCIGLDHQSNKTSKNFDLSLAFQGFKTLDEAISGYFEPEKLVGTNQYKCSLHGLCDAEKRQFIKRFPKVLAVHLKRFSFEPLEGRFRKVTDPLDIPLSLDITKYGIPPSESMLDSSSNENMSDGEYSLSAIVIHEGTLDIGHYYTFARVPVDENNSKYRWVELNDHRVKLVDEETVLATARGFSASSRGTIFQKLARGSVSSNAYVLLYSKKEM